MKGSGAKGGQAEVKGCVMRPSPGAGRRAASGGLRGEGGGASKGAAWGDRETSNQDFMLKSRVKIISMHRHLRDDP